MTQRVSLAGATGMFGGQVARALLDRGGCDLVLLARPGSVEDAEKGSVLRQLRDRGATPVEAALDDPAVLDRAMAGVAVVVSALQGGPVAPFCALAMFPGRAKLEAPQNARYPDIRPVTLAGHVRRTPREELAPG